MNDTFISFGFHSAVVQQDLETIVADLSEGIEQLRGKCFLITGANSMIGTYLVYALMHMEQRFHLGTHIIASSRNIDKALKLFGCFANDDNFTLLIQDVTEPIDIVTSVDYVFHLAGNASPYYIEHDPVGIMRSNIIGMFNVLEYAKKHMSKRVVFASTREVYGENVLEESLSEQSFGRIDCLDARSCYPESKRAAETLCKSYSVQYGVRFNTVRIAHAYGPGMKLSNDGRVMADLLDCAVNGCDIVLHSTGEALRAFCYVSDVITGLLRIIMYGKENEAYNLANEIEEISIRCLAEKIAELGTEWLTEIAGKTTHPLQIRFEIPETRSTSYCNYRRIHLDTRKLENLGWTPRIALYDGLRRTIFNKC